MKSALKQTIASGGTAVGTWMTLAHPAVAEMMVRAGFDFVVVDLEHSVITIQDAGDLIRVIDLAGAAPLVRVTSNNPDQIKRVMDAGAHGILVPMVNSAEGARSAVEAVKYPPQGRRGVGLSRAQGYGTSFKDYCEWLRTASLVITQIEHVDAVDAIDGILAVEGVDGYIIGPYDMSASMGISGRFDHPDFIAAMARVREAGQRAGKPGGVHIVEPDPAELRGRLAEGFRFVAYSVDFRMLDVACRAGLAAISR